MTKAARWIEIAVGLFFLVSAAAKSVDMVGFGVQISAYNVVKDPSTIRVASWFALLVETGLGGALVAGIRAGGLTHLASSAMILVYSTLIAYAWAYHGLRDCGCLGTWISMSPAQSLVKNIVLLAALGFAWIGGLRSVPMSPARWQRAAAAVLSVAVLLTAGVTTATRPASPSIAHDAPPADAARPFAQFVFDVDGQRYDLGKGEHLVALLNATCDHCRRSVPALNKLVETQGLPPMVALMMGSDAELSDFQAQTSPLFGAHLIDTLKFMEFIGSSPPRLTFVRDGVAVQNWDWSDDVPLADIVATFSAAKK